MKSDLSHKGSQLFQVGEFQLNTKEGTLARNGEPLPITPKMFDVLWVLVRNRGSIVTKDELMETVWSDTVVEEGNLTVTIRQLRKVLGDDAHNPTYIQTVARRGYRLIADVSEVPQDNATVTNIPDLTGSKTEAVSSPSHSQMGQVAAGEGSAIAIADWEQAETEVLDEVPDQQDSESVDLEPGSPPANTKIENNMLRVMALSGLVIALVGLGFLGYRMFPTAGSKHPPQITRLTSNGRVQLAAISPDGRFVAYTTAEPEDKQLLWLKNIANESETKIPGPPERIRSLSFSHDGNHLLVASGPKLLKLPIFGGTPEQLLSNSGTSVSVSPDGSQFALLRYVSDDQETTALAVVNADGSDEKHVTVSTRPSIFLRSTAWSPDGKQIATARLTPDGEQEVALINVSDGKTSALPGRTWSTVMDLVWSPDGADVLALTNEPDLIVDQLWSLDRNTGDATRITNDSHNYQGLSISRDGTIALVRAEQDAHVWIAPTSDLSKIRQTSSGFEKYDGAFAISWTADGRFVYDSAPSGRPEVWQKDLSDGSEKQLVVSGASSAVSPDGKYLIFQDKDADGIGLFRLSIADGEKKRLTTGNDIDPAFSPDGTWMVFIRYADDVSLWKLSSEGGEPTKLASGSHLPGNPSVSPDGKLIAFFQSPTNLSAGVGIGVISSEGGGLVRSFTVPITFPRGYWGKPNVQWADNGNAIDFVSNTAGVSNIWRQPIDGRPPFQITSFTDGLIFNFSYSLDGRHIAMSRGKYARDVVLVSGL